MKAPRCVICHDKPLFPVRFKCFPCSMVPSSKRHCSTLTMVCMHCADRYLELDKKPEERSLRKRCIFCDKTVDPLMLRKEMAYEILHTIMDLDDQVYPCSHGGCDFEGSHLDLLDHVRVQCEYRTVQCTECSTEYPLVLEELHKISHPCHTTCTVCNELVPTSRFPQHMEDDHAHYVHCSVCEEYIFQFSYGFHMKERHQARECRYCAKWICETDDDDHLEDCEGIMECPLCVDHAFLKPKEVSSHFKHHGVSNDTLLYKYEDLLEAHEEALIQDRDHVLHTAWIRKVVEEKRREGRTIQKFIKKHERWWI